MEFRGRDRDLNLLDLQLRRVEEARDIRGLAIVMYGRRRVGKTRLVQEFCDRSGFPYFIFQASRAMKAERERATFIDALGASGLPGAELVAESRVPTWTHALRTLASVLPDETPSIVVLDEVPWLVEQDPAFEGSLQTAWDQYLSAKPVLFLLVGSDISVMQAMQAYERPFYGRAAPMKVRPLHLGAVADMTGLQGADAIDAYLMTGGFPEVVRFWEPGMSRADFMRKTVANPLSPPLVAAKLSLLAEFPAPSQARAVLEAIGSGECAHNAIAARAGDDGPMASSTLLLVLRSLLVKEAVTVDLPLSTKPATKLKRYRIADPYLRFWLGCLASAVPFVERGLVDRALDAVESGWATWRGRAVEPVIHESLMRLLPNDRWPETLQVGGWWNRQHNPQIDLVGADREPVADAVHFIGSIKWLERQPFGARNFESLRSGATWVPGANRDTPLVAVSRCGFVDDLPLAAQWGPDDLVEAWR